jgi:hypothetical protein
MRSRAGRRATGRWRPRRRLLNRKVTNAPAGKLLSYVPGSQSSTAQRSKGTAMRGAELYVGVTE